MTDPTDDTPDLARAVEAGSLALVCPYCGATVTINMETVGRPYLTYEKPESIECYATDCGASWEPNGVPRDAPNWERYPDLYDMPKRAADRATKVNAILAAHRPDRATQPTEPTEAAGMVGTMTDPYRGTAHPEFRTQPTTGPRTVETDEREALARVIHVGYCHRPHTHKADAGDRNSADAVLADGWRRDPARADDPTGGA